MVNQKTERPSETLNIWVSDGLVIYGFYNKTLIIVQTLIGLIKSADKYFLMMLLQEHFTPTNNQTSTLQTACFCILRAISSAAQTAVIRLPESALPVPAKFKAVP